MNGKSDKHIVVSDNIHELIMKKQGEFYIKGIKISMQEIADMAILKGIDNIEIDITKTSNIDKEQIPNEVV